MIDEELYQQAADELNSDARRAHLWARACALASDDHDEARYLYTNLRVEELIAERDKAAGSGADAGQPGGPPDGSTYRSEQPGMELSLAPVEGEGEGESHGEADDNEPPVASSRIGVDANSDGSGYDDTAFDEPREDPADSAVSVRTRTQLDMPGETGAGDVGHAEPGLSEAALTLESEDPSDPHDNTLDQTLDDSLDRALDDSLDRALQSQDQAMLQDATPFPPAVDEPELTTRTTFEEPFDTTLIDKPQWLDDDGEPMNEPAADEPSEDPDRALDEASRDGAPSRGEPMVLDNDAHDVVDERPAGTSITTPMPHERHAALGSSRHDPVSSGRQLDDVFAAAPSAPDADDLLVVDLEGRGPVWALYQRADGRLLSVKRGVSWVALLFTLPWLLWRGLFGTALAYALLWLVSLGGLLACALAWSDAGPAAPPLLRAACVGFAVIAVLGLVVVPFLRANRWLETKWQQRDLVMRGEVRAPRAAEARRRIRDR